MSNQNNIKKQIGEQNFNFFSRNFSGDFLSEWLPKIFNNLKDLKYLPESELPKLKILLNSKLENKKEKIISSKTAKEMLDKAGYILYDNIQNKQDYMIFRKYYKVNTNTDLCKFRNYDATARYHKLFWILSKNVDTVKPQEKPHRQDEYSTSSMSIGISKDKKNIIQITSRYNHLVSGCDNTFNSNLDNLIEGLTEAFNKDYNLNLNKENFIELNNFYVHDGKYFHYHYEMNGLKYGDNTIDGVNYNPNEILIFDKYILNLKHKSIKTADGTVETFVDVVNEKLKNGYKIEIRKGEVEPNLDDTNKIIIYI